MEFNKPFLLLKKIQVINIVLGLLVLIVLFSSINYKSMNPSRKKILFNKIQIIQKEGITYKNLYDLLCTYYGKELSAKEIVTKSSLGPEAKKYFSDILEKVGHHEFSQKKSPEKIDINLKFFKEFLR